MADAVGAVCTALDPLRRLVEAHVMAAERLHGDDNTVPVLAKRQDRHPDGSGSTSATTSRSAAPGRPPRSSIIRATGAASIRRAASCWIRRDPRRRTHYDGYSNKLLICADRKPGPIREAACWVHALGASSSATVADIEENARRKASGKKETPLSPIAIEVVRRIDAALFAIERSINGKRRKSASRSDASASRNLVDDLMTYMREHVGESCSRGHDLAKAIQYMLKRWPAFTLFLDDGRVCMSNTNAAERGLRGVALGRKSWLFLRILTAEAGAPAAYCTGLSSPPR